MPRDRQLIAQKLSEHNALSSMDLDGILAPSKTKKKLVPDPGKTDRNILQLFASNLWAGLGDPEAVVNESDSGEVTIRIGDLNWTAAVSEDGSVTIDGFDSGVEQFIGKIEKEDPASGIIQAGKNAIELIQVELEASKQEDEPPFHFGPDEKGPTPEDEFSSSDEEEPPPPPPEMGMDEEMPPMGEDPGMTDPLSTDPSVMPQQPPQPPPVGTPGAAPPLPGAAPPPPQPVQQAPSLPPMASKKFRVRLPLNVSSKRVATGNNFADINLQTEFFGKQNMSRKANSATTIPEEFPAGETIITDPEDRSDDLTTDGLAVAGGDDQITVDHGTQPTGSGASEGPTLSGGTLKTPMESSDVSLPNLREAATKLREMIPSVARRDAGLARRIAKVVTAMGKLDPNSLTTATLEEVGGDESNDSAQDRGHGELQLWGAAAPSKAQVKNEPNVPKTASLITASILSDGKGNFAISNGKRRARLLNPEKLPVTARQNGARLVNAFEVAKVGGKVVAAYVESSPTVQDTQQEASGAEGAGWSAGEKPPLKDMTQPSEALSDVGAPKIREASRKTRKRKAGKRKASATPKDPWKVFKGLMGRAASRKAYNGGTYGVRSRNYGDTVELEGFAKDSSGLDLPMGTVSFTKVHASPQNRIARIEVLDGVVSNRHTVQDINVAGFKRFASEWISQVSAAAKDQLAED